MPPVSVPPVSKEKAQESSEGGAMPKELEGKVFIGKRPEEIGKSSLHAKDIGTVYELYLYILFEFN